MPTAPTGGVSTKLARCLFWATTSTTISKIAQPYFDYFSANQAVGFKDRPQHRCRTRPDNPGLTPGKGYYSYD